MAYRDAETIRGTLACLAPFVERHFVMLNDKPYLGEYEPPDDTEKICAEFPNVEVIHGNWPEYVLRNIGIELCRDLDWMLGFDADEMMTSSDLAKLKEHLSQTKSDAVGFISKVYWHTPDFKFSPDPDHVKVCIIRPSGSVRYRDMQCVDGPYETLDYRREPYITHHHLSWCEPKNILRKVTHCGHAHEYDGRGWYARYFLPWKEGEPVYQPYMTKWEAVRDPLPAELRRLL
jgi:hypothetical protein